MITTIADGCGVSMNTIVQMCTSVFFSFVMAFSMDPFFAAMCLASVPLAALANSLQNSNRKFIDESRKNIYEKSSGIVSSTFGNIMKTIHAFNGHNRVLEQYQLISEEIQHVETINTYLVGFNVALTEVTGIMYLAVFFSFAAYRAGAALDRAECNSTTQCSPSAGEMFTIGLSINMCTTAFSAVYPMFVKFREARSNVGTIRRLMKRKEAIDLSSGRGLKPQKFQGEIVFQNVSFAYPTRPDIKVAKNYELTIPAGKTTALVGRSGCGKSTIVTLLERFYDPLEGKVLLDGKDLLMYNVRWLRKNIGYVDQELTT